MIEKLNFTDFHCHLDMPQFNTTAEEIIQTFFSSTQGRMILVADPYEPESIPRTQQLSALHEGILTMCAAHPHNADKYSKAIEKKIISFLDSKDVIGVGETGLDFYYNLSSGENQISVFRRQIAIAKESGMFLTIHSREAERDVLRILEEEKFDNSVVFHCYTGSIEDASEIIKRGYYISFSGIITFRNKKTDYLREVVKMVPLDRLFSETDAPYLAPEPMRGKTNSPLYVQYVANKIAELKEISVETVYQAVNSNLDRIVSLNGKNIS